ncbi:MAG: hypothetical protein GDA55_01730 [Cellvibrionales bacterium]|nr:hypothetical protein [Cellvibrionales bacterium]
MPAPHRLAIALLALAGYSHAAAAPPPSNIENPPTPAQLIPAPHNKNPNKNHQNIAHRNDLLPACISPSAENHALLTRAITSAFGGITVTIAADAFTRSHRLLTERATHQGLAGPELQGRIVDPDPPHVFALYRTPDPPASCHLLHENSGRIFPLPHLQCTAPCTAPALNPAP